MQLHTGDEKNLHGAMISMEKADISLRYMIQARNKAIDAYQEIMRMQVWEPLQPPYRINPAYNRIFQQITAEIYNKLII